MQTDGQVVERAKDWAYSLAADFFRLSPPLTENVYLDTTDNHALFQMLFNTKVVIYENREEFSLILNHLTHRTTTPTGEQTITRKFFKQVVFRRFPSSPTRLKVIPSTNDSRGSF
jgi:hypothetical protein